MTKNNYDPPSHLADSSKKLWRKLVPRRGVSPERLALLAVALDALDRLNAARVAIAKDGMTTTTPASGVIHIHPLVRVEKDAMATFLRAWALLNFEWDVMTDGGFVVGDLDAKPNDGGNDVNVEEYERRKAEFESTRPGLGD